MTSPPPHYGRRLHVVLVTALCAYLILTDGEVALRIPHLDPAQLGGGAPGAILLPDIVDPKLIRVRVVDHIGITVVGVVRFPWDIGQRIGDACRHHPSDTVAGGGETGVFKL